MPLILSEDLPGFYAAAVKKGQGALEKCFQDHPEDDFEFRPVFRVKKVEFAGDGMCHTITLKGGEDPSSPDVTVPNPRWGLGCDPIMELFGKTGKASKTIKTKQLHTSLEFVIRKLSGVVGIVVTRTDYQQIVGKKHVKNKRKRSEMELPDVFCDGDSDEQPTWRIPGMGKIHSRAELASTALEIEDVVADELHNMLTISFKRPLRAFVQKSQSKDGEITFEEVDPSKMELQAGSAVDSRQARLGRELVGIVPRTMKMRLYFEGGWDDPDILGDDSEGKTCLEELRTYLAKLRQINEAVGAKRELVASFRKKQDEQKANSFCDLAASSYAKKAVEEFNLDITDKTGCWEPCVVEEEWKAWYELRQEAESECRMNLDFEEEEEEEEEDLDDQDEDYFESTRFRRKMLKELRDDYGKALKAAGFTAAKAEAAANGLYIKYVNIVEDGGVEPRTCTLCVRVFSAVGRARFVDLEHEHHARARMSFCEEHAYIKAQIAAFDPEAGTFRVVDDLAGTLDNFVLFNMDCDDRTGACSYSLAPVKQVQKLVAAIFGESSRGSFLNDLGAFQVFMMAAGADTHPFTEMHYDDFCPLGYLNMKFGKKIKK